MVFCIAQINFPKKIGPNFAGGKVILGRLDIPSVVEVMGSHRFLLFSPPDFPKIRIILHIFPCGGGAKLFGRIILTLPSANLFGHTLQGYLGGEKFFTCLCLTKQGDGTVVICFNSHSWLLLRSAMDDLFGVNNQFCWFLAALETNLKIWMNFGEVRLHVKLAPHWLCRSN